MTRLDLNGAVKPRPVTRKSVVTPRKPDHLHAYATGGVILMALLSALLNGYANAQHATTSWAGWGMGLVIPAIILILGKVASLLYKRRHRRTAYITGGVGAARTVCLALRKQHRGFDGIAASPRPADGRRH